jgi:hypothetical protein
MLSSLLDSVIVTEFQATEAYSSLDLTKAKYSISRLFMVEKQNASIRIFLFFGATTPIWALAYLHEILRFA